MPRTTNRLSPITVKRAKPGMHCDGGGLYLQVTTGADRAVHRSWLYRFALNGRERHMGLGSLNNVSLAEARAKAADARKLTADAIDPIERRGSLRAAAALAVAKAMTFDECAAAYIASHRARWRAIKSYRQWRSTLSTYAGPVLGKLPVQAIDTALIMRVIEPLWTRVPETAGRVRGRIEAVLDWATACGYRQGENPARWRGHLDKLLPAQSSIRKVKHHPALPYSEINAFMTLLRGRDAVSARALEFAILTAARTGEVLGAKWDEIDLTGKMWTVPAERMKMQLPHRVPLSKPAVAVLEGMAKRREGAHVFPGDRRAVLSDMALLMLLRRMERDDITAHGFRSTFRDWAAERTNFPNEVCEAALAHVIENKSEAAYRRGDLFEKRRLLMEQWGAFCDQPTAGNGTTVVTMRASA
jgi:integrase